MTTLTSSELLTYLHTCRIETFVAVHFEKDNKHATIRFMDQSEFRLAEDALHAHPDIVDVVPSPDAPAIDVTFTPPFIEYGGKLPPRLRGHTSTRLAMTWQG